MEVVHGEQCFVAGHPWFRNPDGIILGDAISVIPVRARKKEDGARRRALMSIKIGHTRAGGRALAFGSGCLGGGGIVKKFGGSRERQVVVQAVRS